MTAKALTSVDESVARAVLREEYAVTALRLTPLSGGLDHAARTFRVDRPGQPPLVVRVATQEPTGAATLVPRHLRDMGVTAVVAPISAPDGRLVVRRHDLSWTVSPYVDGPDGWTHGMAATDWAALGAVVRAVQGVNPPSELAALVRRDTFDAAAYAAGFHRHDRAFSNDANVSTKFVTAWGGHRRTVVAMLDQLAVLADQLRTQPRQNVLCHGDLHPGNVLVAADGVHIIDWDEVLLAPRERDFIFVPGLGSADSATTKSSAFLAAYDSAAPVEVDWEALTYYRCERVLQDVLVDAGRALDGVTDDDNGPTFWLQHYFQPGGEAVDAIQTAQHLPPHLNRLSGELQPWTRPKPLSAD